MNFPLLFLVFLVLADMKKVLLKIYVFPQIPAVSFF